MNIWNDEVRMVGCHGKPVAPTNLQELVEAIEMAQCCLLNRGCKENDELRGMLDELNQHILSTLGIEGCLGQEEEPLAFRTNPSMTAWVRGSELETVEDILACWYLSECFPWGLSFAQMEQIEKALKARMDTLEAEEAAYEESDALVLWRFRMDIRAEQLDQIQTMMRQFELDEEAWSLEE